MSWLFSQALVAEYSADICLDGALCALWSGTATQRASWLPAKTTDSCQLSRSGMTFKPLTDELGEAALMSFLEAFPAKTSALLAKEEGSTQSEAECGSTWQGSSARFDQATSLWKTHQCLLFEDSTESLATFARWGLMRGGELWELPTPAHLTGETESGLWPTPRCQMNRGICWDRVESGNHKHNIEDFVAIEEGLTRGSGRWSLNPEWCEWLMGWPENWTAVTKPLETAKFQQWQHLHGKCLEGQSVKKQAA